MAKIDPIPGYEGHYAVDKIGNVYSVKNGSAYMLKPAANEFGYLKVNFSVKRGGGKATRKTCKVHRLIAMTYLKNPENKRTVNHKNGMKTDNRLCNLEWATHSENHLHAYKALGRVSPMKGVFGKDNPKSKEIIGTDIDGNSKMFHSIHDAARDLSLGLGNIWSALNGRYQTCGGYKWAYVSGGSNGKRYK